jgi:hypothetical protein
MNSEPLLQAILPALDRGGGPDSRFPDRKGEYWALCPFHADRHPENFSVSQAGYHCFACGASGGLRALAEVLDVLPRSGPARTGAGRTGAARTGPTAGRDAPLRRSTVVPGDNTPPPPPTLENYAAAKRLPVDFLVSLGLTTVYPQGRPAVRIPYLDADGVEIGARLRVALEGKTRFRWRKGTRVHLYGLWRLDRTLGSVILCEGESDAQTLWFHGIPALGVPGAAAWQAAWAEYVKGLTVYVWQEPDQGGDTFSARVGATLPDCRIITPPEGRKDISECHIAGCASADGAEISIPELVERLRREARPWREIRAEEIRQEAGAARAAAAELLGAPDILERFAAACREQGLVGEDRAAKLLFLAGISRLLERPVSCAVKGASSSGKSVTVQTVFAHFPTSAYYALSSMSERSLAYSNEPLAHRMLILYEAAGMASELASYLLRSLLSEGKIRYETIEKTSQGLQPKLIEREGPTGLIVTTTGASLHPENETRMLSVTVRDDPLQTAGVLQSIADRAIGVEREPPDVTHWQALQRWLELAGCREVIIPYADELAVLADSRAVRLRRDFGALLNLIRSHAILHQLSRQRDPDARILATLADYAAVYELVIDIIAQGVQATVDARIRDTVAAVKELDSPKDAGVGLTPLARALGIDKSAASRRVRVAIEDGYLINLEERKGRPARIILGDPLPEERAILPPPEALAGAVVRIANSHREEVAAPPSPGALAGDVVRNANSHREEVAAPPSPGAPAGDVVRIANSHREEVAAPPSPGAPAGDGAGGGVLSPQSTLKQCNGPQVVQIANLHHDAGAEPEPWQQSILDEFDL